jgi:4-hydroxybenzoate polyprenyltransferase
VELYSGCIITIIVSMKFILAFFRLIRWPNLVFIALTQTLFYYCIYLPLFEVHNIYTLVWIIIASVLIAAAGYIINDYFDLNIDQINKPSKNVFSKLIHRRWAIIWHFVLSLGGIVATTLAVGLNKWYLIVANIFCVILLWFYSTSFKRQYLIGNIVISLLTAWTVLIIFFAYTSPRHAIIGSDDATVKFFRIAFLYAAFAFISSLIREAVKDMEDLEGDARYGCKTLPIVSGLRAARIYVSIWTVVLIASLIFLQLYVIRYDLWLGIVYSIVFIIIPLVYLLFKLSRSTSQADFALLSVISKLVMLAGILSMIFFRV